MLGATKQESDHRHYDTGGKMRLDWKRVEGKVMEMCVRTLA